jgi:hypothetical protein
MKDIFKVLLIITIAVNVTAAEYADYTAYKANKYNIFTDDAWWSDYAIPSATATTTDLKAMLATNMAFLGDLRKTPEESLAAFKTAGEKYKYEAGQAFKGPEMSAADVEKCEKDCVDTELVMTTTYPTGGRGCISIANDNSCNAGPKGTKCGVSKFEKKLSISDLADSAAGGAKRKKKTEAEIKAMKEAEK